MWLDLFMLLNDMERYRIWRLWKKRQINIIAERSLHWRKSFKERQCIIITCLYPREGWVLIIFFFLTSSEFFYWTVAPQIMKTSLLGMQFLYFLLGLVNWRPVDDVGVWFQRPYVVGGMFVMKIFRESSIFWDDRRYAFTKKKFLLCFGWV